MALTRQNRRNIISSPGSINPNIIAELSATHPQTSPDGNVTLSIIQYVPSVRDAGKYMSCRAENPELPESSLEDGWKLVIHCEYIQHLHTTYMD